MKRLTDHDLKTKGIGGITSALMGHDECIITVYGMPTFIVMTVQQLEYYRERDIKLAAIEVNKDIENGDYHTDLERHLRDLRDSINDA